MDEPADEQAATRADERAESGAVMRGYLRRTIEDAALFVFLAIFLIVFFRLLTYVLPFVVGLLVALALAPVARGLARLGLPRRAAILAALIIVPAFLIALITLFIAQGASEAAGFSQALPHYLSVWRHWSNKGIRELMTAYGHLPPRLIDALQSTMAQMVDQARQLALASVSAIFTSVTALPDAAFIVVISIVAAYFYLAERERYARVITAWLPPGWGPKLAVVSTDVGRAIAGMLRTQLILIVVTALICVSGLLIMHIHYAFILGALIGLTGWVPIVGSGIIIIPWAVGAFATGAVALGVKILLLQAVASLVRHVIEPQVMAKSVGLGTFPTLLGMYIGLKSLGFMGLILGPLVVIAIRSLLRARIFIDFMPRERPVAQHSPAAGVETASVAGGGPPERTLP